MPIHDVGYRTWEGKKTSQLSRFWIITITGIRLASKSRWVRRMLFFAWLPVTYWAVGFFVIEKYLDSDHRLVTHVVEKSGLPSIIASEINHMGGGRYQIADTIRKQFGMLPNVEDVATGLESGDIDKTRNIVWSWLLMTFFRYPQALLILLLIGTVAPRLISRDLRSRAYLIYFSRPIGKLEYLFGKFWIPAAFIMAVSTLPALALYIFGILMSPHLSVFWSTWDVPLKILTASVVLVAPTATLALMLSSLTQESRFASFAWFALWAMGHGAWTAIRFATAIRMQEFPFADEVVNSDVVKNWSVLSLYNNLRDVQSWIFGFSDFDHAWRALVALGIITLVSAIILYRRVASPVRV